LAVVIKVHQNLDAVENRDGGHNLLFGLRVRKNVDIIRLGTR